MSADDMLNDIENIEEFGPFDRIFRGSYTNIIGEALAGVTLKNSHATSSVSSDRGHIHR